MQARNAPFTSADPPNRRVIQLMADPDAAAALVVQVTLFVSHQISSVYFMSQAGAGEAGEQGAAPQNSTWSMVRGLAFRFLIIYFVTSFFRGKSPAPAADTPGTPSASSFKPSSNLFEKNTVMVSQK